MHPADAMISLEGKSALVTGANQGIGAAIARLLQAQGARVAVNYPAPQFREAAEKVAGETGFAVQADVSKVSEIRSMFDVVSERFAGQLDILVNNAGIFPRNLVMEMDEETWDAVLGVNLKGTFFCAQSAAKLMIPRNSGAIVNITSGAALSSSPNSTHYAASKAGIVSVTKGLAKTFAPHGIRVNAVAPGITDTAQPRYGMTEDEIYSAGANTPLGRIGEPEDIANVVLFLVSDLSSYMTGQTLFVNGGSGMAP